jgi:hypothetical protein
VGSPSRRLQEPLGWYLRTFRAASWERLWVVYPATVKVMLDVFHVKPLIEMREKPGAVALLVSAKILNVELFNSPEGCSSAITHFTQRGVLRLRH